MGEKSQASSSNPKPRAGNGQSALKTFQYKPNNFENFFKNLNDTLSDFPNGVLPIKIRYPVNFQKGTIGLFVLILMSYYNNYSLGSYLYLALHGTYGIFWIIKDVAFPDRDCQAKAGFITTLILAGILVGYSLIAWIQVSGNGINNPTPERIMCCVMLFSLGCIFMMVSDAQKYFTLMYRKGLIAEGMFRYTRNPNYLGEMMLYASFAIATGNYFSWAILLPVWAVVFLGRMIAKDCSLRQKEGAQNYFDQSSLLLPKVFFKNTILHFLSWAAVFFGIFLIYQSGGIVKIISKIPKF